MNNGTFYLLGALLIASLQLFFTNAIVSILLGWLALSLLCVGVAYYFHAPGIFRKRANGAIPIYMKWLFIPFLFGAQLYNAWARNRDTVPPLQQIDSHLYLGCRLFPSDLEMLSNYDIKAILDVTAEFDGLDWSAEQQDYDYLNVPVLDHQSPNKADLIKATAWIERHIQDDKPVVVHCALGRGRSVLVVAAYLLSKDPDLSVREALAMIKQVRETARLNHAQLKALVKVHESGALSNRRKLAVVANPVAGGGKWQQYRDEVINRLSAKYDVSLFETTKDDGTVSQAEKALSEGVEIIVACGGDGTVAEVASVVVSKNVTLGIVPLGTANALAHVLYGVASKVIPASLACDVILEGNTIQMDTAKCNGDLVLLLVGIGFEQKMIANADREAKDALGQFAYLSALYEAVRVNQHQEFVYQVNGESAQQLKTTSLVVANAAPSTTVLAQGDSEPDYTDGLLDLTILPAIDSPGETLLAMARLAMRGITPLTTADQNSIEHQLIKQIKVQANDEPIQYVIDGENRSAKQVSISVVPSSLRVFKRSDTSNKDD